MRRRRRLLNAFDSETKVFDGYLLHSRFGTAAALDGTSIFVSSLSSNPMKPQVRADVRVPVMTVITETDLIGAARPGYLEARQEDSERFRLWEIAGTAHADNYMLQVGSMDSGVAPIEQLAEAFAPTKLLMGMELPYFINFAPQHHYVLQSALRRLHDWVRSGHLPATAKRLETKQPGVPELVVDYHGIACGGIRTPWVEVPIALTSGVSGDPGGIAGLFGSGEPFSQLMLDQLYPEGKSDYLQRFASSLSDAIAAGFLLDEDRDEILNLAAAAWPSR